MDNGTNDGMEGIIDNSVGHSVRGLLDDGVGQGLGVMARTRMKHGGRHG